MQTSQLNLWRSEFGRDYTDRNDREKPERVTSWQRLLDGIVPTRALEIGCNVGWNLEYLRRLGVSELYGIEPQLYAVERARWRGPQFGVVQGTAFDLPFKDGWFDLAFTSGVLIHISPETVGAALDEIYRVSRRWIVAIEYDAPAETEINYRGHEGALWKRDHGGMWMARHPDLRLVRRLELSEAEGYDDCTAHLFEKP
ncbi:MAG: methyltransferase domain-containing protein [Myxococcales bacterium]|nr:methyltransferase domain-containing protein [Myxococcales bacterium]